MNVNMPLILKWIKKRKEQKLYEMKPIGSAIRSKRKSMNMTLEEGAEGICSISYLSKIENNMIQLSEQFEDRLMERFQMKAQGESNHEVYQQHLSVLIKCLIHREKPQIEILSEYQNREDHQSYLIGLIVHHLNQKIEQRNRCFDQLKIFIPNLSHHELAITLVVLGHYFISIERYQDASDIISMSPEETLLSIELSMLLKRIKLIASMRMHRFIDVMDHMNPFMQQAMHLHYYQMMTEVKNEYYRFCALYSDPTQIEKTIHAMSSLKEDEKRYIMAIANYGNASYHQVITITLPYIHQNSSWMVLYLLALDEAASVDLLRQIMTQVPDDIEYSDGFRRIRSHLYYKYHPDRLETLAYLRREILGIRSLPDDYIIAMYLMKDSVNLFTKYQHYKESTQVTLKFFKHMRTLKMAQYRLIPVD